MMKKVIHTLRIFTLYFSVITLISATDNDQDTGPIKTMIRIAGNKVENFSHTHPRHNETLKVSVRRNNSEIAKQAEREENLSRYQNPEGILRTGDVSDKKRDIKMMGGVKFALINKSTDEEIQEKDDQGNLINRFDQFYDNVVLAQRGTCVKFDIIYCGAQYGLYANISSGQEHMVTVLKTQKGLIPGKEKDLKVWVAHYDTDDDGKKPLFQVGRLLNSTSPDDIYKYVSIRIRASNILKMENPQPDQTHPINTNLTNIRSVIGPQLVSANLANACSVTPPQDSNTAGWGQFVPSGPKEDLKLRIAEFDAAYVRDGHGGLVSTGKKNYRANPDIYDLVVNFTLMIYDSADMDKYLLSFRDNSSLGSVDY